MAGNDAELIKMSPSSDLGRAWAALPAGARAALQEQWEGLAAGGLACGSCIVDASGHVIASGRNHAYDAAGPLESRGRYALQHNRLAHAELNALACISTETDHAALSLWSTQHPCSMCAAALAFVGIGRVIYIADDLSDARSSDLIVASRGSTSHEAFGSPLWWTISNILFLHNPAVRAGGDAGSVRAARQRYPKLASLALELAKDDTLGKQARLGQSLPIALEPHHCLILHCAEEAPH
jgi:tRNA(Arg) A34 adenosine deaminase TadA